MYIVEFGLDFNTFNNSTIYELSLLSKQITKRKIEEHNLHVKYAYQISLFINNLFDSKVGATKRLFRELEIDENNLAKKIENKPKCLHSKEKLMLMIDAGLSFPNGDKTPLQIYEENYGRYSG